MRSSYVTTLESLYAAHDDVGLQITKRSKSGSIEVECKRAFKSLTLIPWATNVIVELSDSSQCKGLQCVMGEVDGQYVKAAPKQSAFDQKATAMVALCCALALTLHGLLDCLSNA